MSIPLGIIDIAVLIAAVFSSVVIGLRFRGIQTKRVASILFLVTRNLGDGLRLFLAAMVLKELVGWPMLWSAVAIGVITMLYTYCLLCHGDSNLHSPGWLSLVRLLPISQDSYFLLSLPLP